MFKNNTIKTYDIGASDYHSRRKQSWVGRNNLDNFIKDAKSILDFGCGPGILIPELIRLNFCGSYVGYDPSEGMIKEAVKSYLPTGQAGQSPVSSLQSQELSFKNEFSTDLTSALTGRIFDTVLAIAVFHHLTLTKIEESLNKVKNSLNKNARIIITLWQTGKSERHKKFRIGNTNQYSVPLRDNQGKEVGKRLYYDYDVNVLKSLFAKCGFEFVAQKEISGEGFSNVLLEFKKT